MKPTSRKRTVRGVKEEATQLWSKLIRTRRGPLCEAACGNPAQDAAHIIGRKYSHTRTDLNNGFALCKRCHGRFTDHHGEWMEFVDAMIGRREYDRLWEKARSTVKFDWYDELDRLRGVAESEGLAA